ncbi:MAG: potassium-transporting ATPase subunit KdpC [Opitutae bacterium]|nr:potassium-transporting ATPase subunit KdpC [Opitutae bacterium]
MKTTLAALRLLVALTLLTGLAYPLAVWALGRAFFRDAAEGSLLHRDGQLVGSALLAQKTTDPRYFWPRPSAADFATVASGASNQAWTSARLHADLAARRTAYAGTPDAASAIPSDLLTASGSGLDPEISLAAAQFQIARIAAARRLTAPQRNALADLVAQHAEGGQLSPARVNVLRLNLALDTAFPAP